VVSPTAPAITSKADLAQMLAWQRGQAIFDNTRLAAALYEMNRYSTSKLVIAGDGIADLRISGVFSFGDSNAFAQAVSRLLPVKTSGRDHGQVIFTPDTNRSITE
jgi:transmembrane sensor